MGELGLYLLIMLFLFGILALVIFTFRWIKKIVRLIKTKKYIQAILAFIIPVAVASILGFFISEIIEAILIGLAAFMAIGFMMSIKFPNYYYYDE